MEQFHPDGVGEAGGEVVGGTGERVHGGELRYGVFEGAGGGGVAGGVAVEVEVRGRVGVDLERCGGVLLGREQPRTLALISPIWL